MVKRHRKGCFRAAKTKDLIDSQVMEVTPEKVDTDQPLPTTTYVTPVDKVGSLAKKRGRPSKEDSISAEKASDQITSDATPAKTQKLTDNLDSSGNSKTTTPVSIQGKSMKGKKGFQKRSSVVRALFTASQELMPPPLTTSLSNDTTMDLNDTTMDLTLSNLTLNSDTTPTVEDNWTNEDTLLANILGETHFRRTLTTLPIQLSANDFSIENKLRLNFNTQSFNDSTNCGYYVCLYAEMNLTTNF
uniref:Uncharacterized protein n=1 Tax=Romanomermis culicivorax TaxID=13658 RepID=A0A915IRU9_ROMCU